MTGHKWHFRAQRKGDRDRNPIQNEFFASEAVGSMISALVREGLQNSGDARSASLAAGQPVRVRIFASEDSGALTPEKIAFWGQGLWSHVAASDSGLRHAPQPEEPCRFLTFEDFGTTGLLGSTSSDDATREPFYCFFRAENSSSKTASSGGSWGVGKTAFPRVSRANAFFGLTTRESDGRSVVMGSLTLRTRHVDGAKYTPDSWFGTAQPGEAEGGVIQPIEDAAVLKRFREDFRLARIDQAGTSLVVPWCDASITRDAIVGAVIEANFLPIVWGELEVVVASDGQPDVTLNAETIEAAVGLAGVGNVADLLSGIKLAQWARSQSDAERVSARHEPSPHSVKWDQYSIPDADRERLSARFEEGRPIALRVPVPMKRKGQSLARTSHLDVFLQRTSDGSTVRPVFVRGSVVVPDHQIKRVSGGVAIIRSSSDELQALLRAAEDPGHKEWSTETNNFAEYKENFAYAKSYLTLAREAALRCFRLLQDVDAEEDLDILGDVFSLPREPDDEAMRKGGSGGRPRKTKRPVVEVKKQQRVLAVSRVDGGFSVARAAADSPTPARVRVRAAYDVRARNPFTQWEPEDFEFGKAPIVIERADGLEQEMCEGNRLVLKVLDPEFHLSVRGFDTERGDLIVDVRPEGRLND